MEDGGATDPEPHSQCLTLVSPKGKRQSTKILTMVTIERVSLRVIYVSQLAPIVCRGSRTGIFNLCVELHGYVMLSFSSFKTQIC